MFAASTKTPTRGSIVVAGVPPFAPASYSAMSRSSCRVCSWMLRVSVAMASLTSWLGAAGDDERPPAVRRSRDSDASAGARPPPRRRPAGRDCSPSADASDDGLAARPSPGRERPPRLERVRGASLPLSIAGSGARSRRPGCVSEGARTRPLKKLKAMKRLELHPLEHADACGDCAGDALERLRRL